MRQSAVGSSRDAAKNSINTMLTTMLTHVRAEPQKHELLFYNAIDFRIARSTLDSA